mmetsp:Transcript_25809/g.56942  ORF Transcript_25809/g.56942 Transcript_25809/m.56942 type:complete len:320 (-) Transcript_25809:65-1024(-)
MGSVGHVVHILLAVVAVVPVSPPAARAHRVVVLLDQPGPLLAAGVACGGDLRVEGGHSLPQTPTVLIGQLHCGLGGREIAVTLLNFSLGPGGGGQALAVMLLVLGYSSDQRLLIRRYHPKSTEVTTLGGLLFKITLDVALSELVVHALPTLGGAGALVLRGAARRDLVADSLLACLGALGVHLLRILRCVPISLPGGPSTLDLSEIHNCVILLPNHGGICFCDLEVQSIHERLIVEVSIGNGRLNEITDHIPEANNCLIHGRSNPPRALYLLGHRSEGSMQLLTRRGMGRKTAVVPVQVLGHGQRNEYRQAHSFRRLVV